MNNTDRKKKTDMYQALKDMPNELDQYYKDRQVNFQMLAESYKSKATRLSLVRLFYFLIMAFVLIYIWTSLALPIALLLSVVIVTGFLVLVKRYQKMLKLQLFNASMAQVNADEIDALGNNYSMFNDGSLFIDEAHNYSSDLDIFGAQSLFQYLNRAETWFGRKKLASFLMGFDSREEVISRQEAVQELKPYVEFRQSLRASAFNSQDDSNKLKLLKEWFAEKDIVKGSLYRYSTVLAFVFSIVFFVLQYHYFLAIWTLVAFLPIILILRKLFVPINDIHQKTGKAEAILNSYSNILAVCEKIDLKAPFNKELLNKLGEEEKASDSINKLSYILSQLNVRYNVFVIFLNLLGAWDIYWVYRLEKWRASYKSDVFEWFDMMGSFEALNALANLSFNKKDWVVPVLVEKGMLEGRDLGHPLIKDESRVSNNFDCPSEGHTKLLTGSNMAGKSTFLRTVGLNIVLANAGSVVCAKALSLPMLRVITSMRNSDNLHDSTSSFYAELKRIRKVINLVKAESNVFYLLDEILKGTNSKDRHKGSRALILQLIRDRGAGIVATHDLDLGNMQDEHPALIENICLEVDIKGNELDFDYKIQKGVCKSLNASILMQNMGIDL
jgi:hypothetical protein